MNPQNVDMYMLTHNKYFRDTSLPAIRQRLMTAPEQLWSYISTLQLKDPVISIILSILLGSWGIDRFYVGDTGLGILKLITGGGCGIWIIVDWFLIMGITKDKNEQTLNIALSNVSQYPPQY